MLMKDQGFFYQVDHFVDAPKYISASEQRITNYGGKLRRSVLQQVTHSNQCWCARQSDDEHLKPHLSII